MVPFVLNGIQNLCAAASSRMLDRVISDFLPWSGTCHGNRIRVAARCREGIPAEAHVLGRNGFREFRIRRTEIILILHSVSVGVSVVISH